MKKSNHLSRLKPVCLWQTLWRVFLTVFIMLWAGCADLPHSPTGIESANRNKPKLIVVILDALKRKTLMDSIDSLPNFRSVIQGERSDYPYIYFENVLVSIPSSSKPSNTTLLTGVYPRRHGIPSTLWFDRKAERLIKLTSISQRRIINILRKTDTDTLFDYARRSGKSAMAVATQVTKGVEPENWIKQSVHLWGQAFCLNLLRDRNPIPDGAHIDRGTTRGLLKGHMYSNTDGFEGWLRTFNDLPDLTVLHFIGMDIFTHYPRRFMVDNNWAIDDIQKWYLKEVLDPELGKILTFLKKHNQFENTIFFFVSDHGQTRILQHVDEEAITRKLAQKFRVLGKSYTVKNAEVVIMPGASTKTMYIKNRVKPDWLSAPRLLEDVKPVVDAVIDMEGAEEYLNALLVAQYPGERTDIPERRKDPGETDVYWILNPNAYRQSNRTDEDFISALESLSKLDEMVGKKLNAATMYRQDFDRTSMPDIILINTPGYYFTPDRGKYAHHGGIYPDDAYVSFVVSGPGIHRLSDHPRKIIRQIDTIDLVPMAAFLGGFKIDKPVDGTNRLLEIK